MRRLALLILFVAGCSSEIGKGGEGTVDARPIDYEIPPEPKEGSGTAPGCDGITARGECQQKVAVYCDLDRNALRRVDCGAQGTECIRDVARGAVCKSVDADPNGGNSPCTDTNISEKGYCSSEDVAVFCDTSGTDPVTRTWNCKAEGKTCNDCPNGERCCGGDVEPPMMPCGAIDFDGVCEGETVKYCLNDNLVVKDCAATGQFCNDTCATGNFCCGAVESNDECTMLGFDGKCNADNMGHRFCLGDEIFEWDCEEGETCMEDTCGTGASCCDSETMPPTNRCTELGGVGACTADGKVEYCLGDEEADIVVQDCPATNLFCLEPGTGSCNAVLAYCCPLPDPG